MKVFFREILITTILALTIFFIVNATVQTFVVVGPSMLPNFENGQRLLVSKVAYRLHEPERGDVVIFEAPNNEQEDYIKRIIGLPGDTVEVKDGAVYVNGAKRDEPYITNPPNYTLEETKIPENDYFVLGDNRINSNDSHSGWLVPRENIIGKAWLSIWPYYKWRIVAEHSLQAQMSVPALNQLLLEAHSTAMQCARG
jgi:signal peptidase I